jgi:hypothetical protein
MPLHLYVDTSGTEFWELPSAELAAVLRQVVDDIEGSPELDGWVEEMRDSHTAGALLPIQTTQGRTCGYVQWSAEEIHPGLPMWPTQTHTVAPQQLMPGEWATLPPESLEALQIAHTIPPARVARLKRVLQQGRHRAQEQVLEALEGVVDALVARSAVEAELEALWEALSEQRRAP